MGACLNVCGSRSRLAYRGAVGVQCGDVWSVASARVAGARAGRRGWGRDAGAVVLVRLGSDQGGGDPQVSMGAVECGLMQWVRAACVRPGLCMRVCAWSYLGRSIVVKSVVDIFATTFKSCLSVCLCLSVGGRMLRSFVNSFETVGVPF